MVGADESTELFAAATFFVLHNRSLLKTFWFKNTDILVPLIKITGEIDTKPFLTFFTT